MRLSFGIPPFGCGGGVKFRFSNDTDSGVACTAVTGMSGTDSMAEIRRRITRDDVPLIAALASSCLGVLKFELKLNSLP